MEAQAPGGRVIDPELARICELREAMALSPGQLIAKLRLDTDAIGLADHEAEGQPGGIPRSVAAIPALADLASIVTSLQDNPASGPGRT